MKLMSYEIDAYKKGIRVTKDCQVIGIKGRPLKMIYYAGYPSFSVKIGGKVKHVTSHRLLAYQKFGDKIFEPGIQVRHLNGIKADFMWDNITIGTASQNHMDKPKEVRDRAARIAAKARRRFSDDDIREIRKLKKEGLSLRIIGEKFGISKGHTSDIVNLKIYNDVS